MPAGQRVTIVDIIRDETAKRVYNFEVESLPGQITSNYMVGDDAAWVHNHKADKLFGFPKKFWRWYHRKYKRAGDQDLPDYETACEIHEEWCSLGCPGPDNNSNRRNRR